jgi:hypothetical protein
MKKAIIVLFVLLVAAVTNSFAQTATPATASPAPTVKDTTDFFAGKWEVLMIGIPDGDKKFIANFTRQDGKLTGDLSDPTDAKAVKVPFTSIEEEAEKITLAFSAQGYDLTLPLEKVDADNLKGQLMGMFETKAVRVK